jgi:hypothetical protein
MHSIILTMNSIILTMHSVTNRITPNHTSRYPCNGTASQQWELGPAKNGTQQIYHTKTDSIAGAVGAAGKKMCIGRPTSNTASSYTPPSAATALLASATGGVSAVTPPPDAPGGGLEFDVKAELGWESAHVYDACTLLWILLYPWWPVFVQLFLDCWSLDILRYAEGAVVFGRSNYAEGAVVFGRSNYLVVSEHKPPLFNWPAFYSLLCRYTTTHLCRRDLWSHKDLGVMSKIVVQLTGDGDAAIYKLTKAK